MAVKIPTIERMEPNAPASVGRVDAPVPEFARAAAQLGQQTERLGGAIVDTMNRMEDQAIDTTSNALTNEYETWYKKKLHGDSEGKQVGLSQKQGDPTEDYNAFDEEAMQKQKDLIENSNLSGRGKKIALSRLANKHNSLYGSRLVTYGNQYATYEKKVTDDSVALEQRAAADSVGYLNPADPKSTVAPFEASIGRIRDLRIRQALKRGTAQDAEDGPISYVDDDGNLRRVKLNQSAQYEIAKDISEATTNSVESLLAVKDTERAKIMMDRYGDQIDPVNKRKLDEKFDKLDSEEKAFKALANLEDKSFPQQKSEIRKLPTRTAKEIQIKQEALKLIDANERYKTNIQNKDSKEVYDTLANKLLKARQQGDPFDSIYQLESDPEFSKLIGRVTDSKQRKALYEMVEAPTKSDQDVYTTNLELLRQNQYYGMTGESLQLNLVGLKEADKKFFIREWTKQNTESESQERGRVNFMAKELYRQLDGAGLLKRDRFGKLRKSSKELLNRVETQLREQSEEYPKNMSVQEVTRQMQKDVSRVIMQQEKMNKSPLTRFKNWITGEDDEEEEAGIERPDRVTPPMTQPRQQTLRSGARSSQPEAGAPPVNPKGFSSLSPQEKASVIREYIKAKGQKPSASELSDYYNSKLGL